MPMIRPFKWTLLIAALAQVPLSPVAADSDAPLGEAAELLKSKKFSDKSKAVELLATAATPQAKLMLNAMLDSRLYYVKKDKRVVTVEKQSKEFAITDAITGEAIGSVGKRKVKKLSLNNKLRSQIRSALAVMDLRNPDAEKRLAAVDQMLDRPSAENAALVRPLLEQETVDQIREAMKIVIALGDLGSEDKALRMAAVGDPGRQHPPRSEKRPQ